MEFTPFRKIIQPKLTTIGPFSPFGMFYKIFAEALNEWFDKRIIIQLGIVNGTITAPNGATTPFFGNYLKPQAESLNLDPAIMQSYALTQEELYPNIFSYIGLMINQSLRIWTSTSSAWSRFLGLTGPYVTPVQITTTLVDGIFTAHFYKYGKDFIERIKTEPPEDPNTFDLFWDEFERYLKDAMKHSPVATGIATGTVPPGVFNGTAIIKLLADSGDNNEE